MTVLLYLFTEGPQVDGEGETVASRLLVALKLGEVEAESQQGHGHKWRQFLELGRLKK